MKKKLKIAIYSGSIPSTTFIEHLIHEVAKHHTVLLFGNIKSHIKYNNANIKIISTPYEKWRYIPLTIWRMLLLFFKRPSYIKAAYQRAKQYPTNYLKLIRFTRYIAVLLHEPDIFHLQWARRIERWTFLKEVYDCKLMLSLLGTQITVAPRNNKTLADSFKKHFPKVDYFNAVSKHTADEALKYGVDPQKIQVLYIPISQLVFDKFRIPKKTDGQPIEIVSVGRYDWVKGYRYAIDAIKLLIDQGHQVKYTIIAQGKVNEDLLFQVHQLGIQSHVAFEKSLAQEQLFSRMQEFDILLLPSVTEGIANVALEGMALGIPVISTDCGGMPEVVKTNQTGWLVSSRDPQAICDAVLKIKNTSDAHLREVVKEAHDLATKYFHPSNGMKHFIEAYSDLKNKSELGNG
ncbi:MAG: glycosyltransferase family 4 protein [Bacteroidia bacterium]|nr:glycosyltransferase family 4 protein [Bacteroidia bacterium]NNE16457.1 glycosyltransferase family 4 protein [Saprospiraceae bacterium]RZW48086.1 MAG: glycosyltransferase [Flavobacteriaceae bacterium]